VAGIREVVLNGVCGETFLGVEVLGGTRVGVGVRRGTQVGVSIGEEASMIVCVKGELLVNPKALLLSSSCGSNVPYFSLSLMSGNELTVLK